MFCYQTYLGQARIHLGRVQGPQLLCESKHKTSTESPKTIDLVHHELTEEIDVLHCVKQIWSLLVYLALVALMLSCRYALQVHHQ